MPTWNSDELSQLQQKVFAVSTSPTVMAQRIGKIGGIPRLIFSTERDLDNIILEALSRSSLDKFSTFSGVLEGNEDVSNVLVHLVPSLDYKSYTIKIASPGIKLILADAFETQEKEKLRKYLSVTPRLPISGRLWGDLFEGWTHRILRIGGTFEIRNLKSGRKETLTIPLCQDQQVENFSDTGSAKNYYRPYSENFGCIDSWIPRVGFFQVTVSKDHPIREDGIALILAKTTMRKFYFVVPNHDDDDRFEKFKAQRFKSGKTAKAMDTDFLVEQLEQYVLKLKL